MLWLKRNLFMALGGLVALVLLAGGGYYLWTNKQKSGEVDAALQEKRQKLEQIYNDTRNPFPNSTNIAAAKAELGKVRDTVQKSRAYFAPIVPPQISPQEFRLLLVNSMYDLRRRAEQEGIDLPGRNYAFSFEAQGKGLTFGPGTFPELPQQLAEIHALTSILFDAKINKLISIRRTRVSADDEANRGAPDYHDLSIQTNDITKCLVTPYMFEFQSFTPELAKIVESIQTSTNGFLVKSVSIEPAPVAAADMIGQPAATPPPPGFRPTVPVRPAAPPDPFGRTILDERMLRIRMLVEVIKCPATEPAQTRNTADQQRAGL